MSALVLGAASLVSAQDRVEIDKSHYTLFNPTPDELMREISPDRPDITESPTTVDAGHVQVELSFFEYQRDVEDDAEIDIWTFAASNIKVGLTNRTDLQFVFNAYTDARGRDRTTDDTEHVTGFRDLTLRLKHNIWGNDAGDTALGIMPYITLPTGADDLTTDHVEGGLILPFSMSLPDGWSFATMAEIDFLYDTDDDDYDTQLLHSAVVSRAIVGDLNGYLEYAGIVSGDAETDYQPLLSTGLTYQLDANTILDTGVVVGLNDEAEDLRVFTGMTVRF